MSTARLPVVLPMICTCQLANEEVADDFFFETCTLLKCAPRGFLTAVVQSLEFHFENGGHISTIYCDQWAAVTVIRNDGSRVYCECDRVEDGLAAIWRWFYDNATRSK